MTVALADLVFRNPEHDATRASKLNDLTSYVVGAVAITSDPTIIALAALNATPGIMVETAADVFTKRTLQAPAAGFTITNPAGTAGDPTFVLANDLAALEALASIGIAVRTAANTWAQRTISGTSNRVSVSNGDGVSGNPTLDIDAAYVGQTSITTVGTIAAGIWHGTAIDLTAYVAGDLPLSNLAQGTARSVLAVAGNATADYAPVQGTASQFLGINAAGTALAFQTMSGDATLSSGAITLATVNAGAGTYGSSSQVAQIVVNAKGLVTTAANITITPAAIGAIATADLDTDGTLAANSDSKVASQKATKTYVDGIIAAQDAMVFKGVIDCSTNPNYPAADKGWTYRVSVAGKIGGASGTNVEAGDILLCLADGTASGTQAGVGASWSIIQTNLDGAVIGPASATDNGFARFDGTTGKLIKNSAATISLTSEVSGTLPATNGGTGLASFAVGDILFASTTTALSALADVAAGNVLISGGVNTAPSWGKVGISTHVSGLGTNVATALGVNVGSAGAFVTFNGAGGTPASLTLTNATGLPAAGLVASTSQAVGFGSIELGHASDTTLARASAGDVNIEGNIIYRAGGTDVAIADGGTGRSTSTTAYGLIAAGTTATGAHQTLAAGATTEALIGGGASALPVWTTCTGTGAPARAGSPTFTGTLSAAAIDASGTINAAATFQIAAANFAVKSSNYIFLYAPGLSTQAISLGNASDPTNYYDNDGHAFRSAGGGSSLGRVDSSGLTITGSGLTLGQTPTSAVNTATHYVTMTFNGVAYKVLLHS